MTILLFFAYQNVLEWSMDSKIMEEKIYFDISLPETFEQDPDFQQYPIIFLSGSHGQQFFHTAVGIIRHLESMERMPRCIITTLAGHTPQIQTNGMWRRSEIPSYGNPQAFLQALDEEVFPKFKNQFRAANFRIIVGVSGSCLFPLYSFSENPERFHASILLASSDMIGMGVGEVTFLDQFLEHAKQGKKHTLFLGYAEGDLYNNGKLKTRYIKNLDRLKSELQNSTWNYTIKSYEESHYGIYIPGLHQGLDLIFPLQKWLIKYRPYLSQKGQTLANLQKAYTDLSNEYGFQIRPRTYRWNSVNSLEWLTDELIREKRFKEALECAELWTSLDPTRSAGLEAQSRILKELGDYDSACQAIEQALKTSQLTPEKRGELWVELKRLQKTNSP